MIYLFVGEDEISKKIKLNAIKKENLKAGFDNFNFQIFFAKELTLLALQEYLRKYPFQEKFLILVIKEIENLDIELKNFLLAYINNINNSHLILVLDIFEFNPKEEFINSLINNPKIKIVNFKKSFAPSIFNLGRLINQKRTQDALLILNELLLQKTQAQKIIGGLRYQWEKEAISPKEKTRRFDILLETDKGIKTGLFKPEFALEVLLVKLCN